MPYLETKNAGPLAAPSRKAEPAKDEALISVDRFDPDVFFHPVGHCGPMPAKDIACASRNNRV
jgi:hypothetical protein